MSAIIDIAYITQRPEHDILLHAMLSADEATPCKPVTDNSTNASIDWNYLLDMAENHGLTPLLYHFLTEYHRTETPQDVLDTLHDRYRANQLRNRLLTQELIKLLHLFKSRSIHALAYKGPSLTLSIYGDIGMRQFGDLDVLINPDDVPQACQLLTQLGFNRTIPYMSPAKELAFIHMDHEHEFVSNDQLVYIDLHWALSTRRFPFELQPGGLFTRAQQLAMADGDIEHIADQDMLLLLSMHINKDLWRKLVWICDIDRLVRTTGDIDWDSLVQQSINSRCQRMLYLALLISHELLRTPVPETILQAARSPELLTLAHKAIYLCLREEVAEKDYLQCLRIQPFILSMCDNNIDRFRYISRALWRPTELDMQRFNLPPHLHFIYYFITPIRKITFCTTRLLKRLVFR